MLQKLTLAIPEAILHHRAHLAFTETLKSEDNSRVDEWQVQIEAWEQTHDGKCPYDLPDDCKNIQLSVQQGYSWRVVVNFAEVKKQLSKEDHEQLEKEGTESTLHLNDMTLSVFLITGLEIQEQQ